MSLVSQAVEAIDPVKHFGDNAAVDGVRFVVPEGTVLRLLGHRRPLQHLVLVSVAWSVVLTGIFAPLAFSAFQRRSQD